MSISLENERLVLARNTIREKMVSWGIAENTDNLTVLAQKLNAFNLKQGIGYPVRIEVTTPPVKTEYEAGEFLSTSGMVVKAIWSDDTETDITNQCSISPSTGSELTTANTSISIKWTWNVLNVEYTTSQAITVEEAATEFRIVVANTPTKTVYDEGDKLDLTGVKINLEEYNDKGVINTTDVTSACTFNPANGTTLTTSVTSVAVSYVMN